MIPGSRPTALWEEVQGACDLARVQQVLAASPKPQELVLDGWSPLLYLCDNRSVVHATRAQGIAALLRAGVDANFVDENGWSALHLLCKNNNVNEGDSGDLSASVRHLVAAKASVNLATKDSKKTPLHFLCENEVCSADAIDALLKARADVKAVDENRNTPLHYAAESHAVNEQILALLLAGKANPNVQNQFQATPFHHLCQNSSVSAKMLQTMLTHRADPNIVNNIGNTPVHYLCANTNVSVAMLQAIIDSGKADLTILNSLHQGAFDCIPANKPDCITYLEKYAPQEDDFDDPEEDQD